ncbi:ABC transporter ATP-binding protein C-terminal domain-containing protein, partial [Streptomyces cyaneofuscatus]
GTVAQVQADAKVQEVYLGRASEPEPSAAVPVPAPVPAPVREEV